VELHHSHSDVSAMVLLFFGPDPKTEKSKCEKLGHNRIAAKLSVRRLALQYLKIPLILESIHFIKKLPKMEFAYKLIENIFERMKFCSYFFFKSA
jgi:hypothetical protein